MRGKKRLSRPRLVVGLTGCFGSGKSTVARIWKARGASVIDCDRLVHQLYGRNRRLRALIKRALGLRAFERKAVARVVFRDAKKRKRLEALIHPYVFKRVREMLRAVKRGIVVVEIPLLFETGFQRETDVIVVVTAKKDTVIRRLGEKGFSEPDIRLRWRAQWPVEEKIRRSDFTITNNRSRLEIKQQASQVWSVLEKMA